MKLIFIHGAGGTKRKWRKMEKYFSEEEIILYDLREQGQSVGSSGTIEEHARKLTEKLSESCILVGHSMGGLIALEAASLSDHVKGIVLVASSYQLPVDGRITETLEKGTYPEFLFRASFARSADPDLVEEEYQELGQASAAVALNDFQACNAYKNGEKLISELKKPILAILGEEDRLVSKSTPEDLKRKNSEITIHTIEDAGHSIILETPKEVADAIIQFRESILVK